ncbi:MAG: RNA methyltransferase, partial [Lachnospiraceae bacterium]|nr:RNA methyltransferase [Lachnospiraceae bacterium]
KLREKGVSVYAAHLGGTKAYDGYDYRKRTAFLIGNEANGLREETAACADTLIRIPMQGEVESLNAAVASSILLFEASRQRRMVKS